jgi:hypothetical protein
MPWFFRSKDRETDADFDASSPREVAPNRTVEERLLNLQRSVGNQSVQRMVAKSSSEAAAGASPARLTQSEGESLPQGTREAMESRFGESFDYVRIHADEEAATSAVAFGANAYTTGRDIYFARGKYAPTSPEGERLLAHELTHVVQQERRSAPASGNDLSDPHDLAEREAEAVADATERGERIPAVVSTGKDIQRDVGWAQRGPLADPYGTLLLLNAFAAKFPAAAKLILQNPAAMKLVGEAEADSVKFGGYAEDGPAPTAGRAYTAGKMVYVPKTRTDPVLAMRDFLFELNNALRQPKFAELEKEGAKGSTGSLTAKQYALRNTELEVEGMIRLGEIWFETKKALGTDPKWNKYDIHYYLSEYNAFKAGKKTKDDIVKDVLKRVYDTGTLKGKTVEQFYIEQYNELSGGK